MTLHGIRLDPDGGDVVDTFHTVDISRSGMGVISSRAYYPGQRIVLCLPTVGGGGRRNVCATVVRCRPGEEGFHVGVKFDALSFGAWAGAPEAAVAA
jgi:hypothetical protein